MLKSSAIVHFLICSLNLSRCLRLHHSSVEIHVYQTWLNFNLAHWILWMNSLIYVSAVGLSVHFICVIDSTFNYVICVCKGASFTRIFTFLHHTKWKKMGNVLNEARCIHSLCSSWSFIRITSTWRVVECIGLDSKSGGFLSSKLIECWFKW